MRFEGTKKANESNIAIFDTEGLYIEDIVFLLAEQGWSFDRLRVSYTNSNGITRRRDIPYDKVEEIQSKYHFAKWSMEVHRGRMTLSAVIDNSKTALAVLSSKNHALDTIRNMPSAFELYDDEQAFDHLNEQDSASIVPYTREKKDQQNHDGNTTMLEEQSREKPATNSNGNNNSKKNENKKKRSKHGVYFLIAILELLTIAPFVCSIIAIIDTARGRKLFDSDPSASNAKFSEAKTMLILGFIFAVAMIGIFVWKIYPLLDSSGVSGLIDLARDII